MIVVAMILMGIGQSQAVLYTGIALVGFGNSNIFSIVFAEALKAEPQKQNEVSGLMIMGLFGGTIFPLFMGFASQAVGTVGAVLVMAIGAIYLTCYTLKIKK
jgi:fucose permease